MTEISLAELSPRLQEHAAKARTMLDRGQTRYAANICLSLLKRRPECLPVRQLLRQAQYRHYGRAPKTAVGGWTWQSLPARCYLSFNALRALVLIEEYLTCHPYALEGHRIVGRAAGSLGLWHTAVFAYQTVRHWAPDDSRNLMALAESHLQAGNLSTAIEIGEALIEKEPANLTAGEFLQHASVALSIRQG